MTIAFLFVTLFGLLLIGTPIAIALGLSSGAGLIFRGKIWRGILSLVFFCSIPIVIWIIEETAIPWTLVGPLVLIGIGVIILVKAFILPKD